MQIKQSVLRIAAATTVTVFMAAGAMAPVYAMTVDDESSTSSTGTTQSADRDANRAERESETPDETEGTTEDEASSDHSDGNASTTGDSTEPQPESNADENDGGANAGDCDDETAGSYCSTRDGSKSENGAGDGAANGKPCAGCVGKADNKNPKGQAPDGSDDNKGYECDENQGVGQSNPAHTGCTTQPGDEEGEDDSTEETCPEGAEMIDGQCVVPGEETCPEGAEMVDGQCVVPAEGETCPEGAEMVDGQCVVPAEETCPEGATMDGELCVVPAVPVAPADDIAGADDVAGADDEVQAEVLGVEAEGSSANRAPASVAPAEGILPAAGAGDYAVVVLAGLGLLGAGGVLIARRRPRSSH